MKRKFDHPPGLSLSNGPGLSLSNGPGLSSSNGPGLSLSNGPAADSGQPTGPKYWRSLDELAGTPGFKAQLEREFPEGASELDGVDRRHFMKIMAASFALGGVGLAGCRRPEKFILPMASQSRA